MKDDELLDKYNGIWEIVEASKKNLIVNLHTKKII